MSKKKILTLAIQYNLARIYNKYDDNSFNSLLPQYKEYKKYHCRPNNMDIFPKSLEDFC